MELVDEIGLYDYGARWYDPAIVRFTTIDPLADQFANQSPYHYVYNNPLRFTDPTGMSGQDIIDIEKTTGQITVTQAEGDDVVRLVDGGAVQDQYTYGENGSFTEENRVESANGSNTQMITFGDSEKAQTFFEFAANSDVEFAKIDFDSPLTNDKSIVMTDQNPGEVRTNAVLINLVLFQGAEISRHSHSHPMAGGYWPTGYDLFSQKPHPPGHVNHLKGDVGHVRQMKSNYPGFKSTVFDIITPSTGQTTTYDGVTKFKVKDGN